MTKFLLPHKPVIGVNTLYEKSPERTGPQWGNTLDAYKVLHHYVDQLFASGAFPLLVPAVEEERLLDDYLDQVDGFLFIGGPDYPSSYFNEPPHPQCQAHKRQRPYCDLYLMRSALQRKLPILGICAGEQLLNIALGGKLIQHLSTAECHNNEQYHEIRITGGKILKSLAEAEVISVNTSHHQAVDPAHLGKNLIISAYAADGIVEAIESTGDIFTLGLQFHIERIRDKEFSQRVFRKFLSATRESK